MRTIVDLDGYTRPALGRFGEPPISADPVRLRVLLSQLLDLGLTSFLCPSEPRILDVLSALRSTWTFEVIPLLVDAGRQSRALQTYGFVGFARRRLLAAGPVGAARATLGALPRLASLARADYVDGTLFLAALELSQFARFRPRRAFLHANSADPATANRNERLFRGFVDLAAKRGLRPGVMTNNAGWLAPLLDAWGLQVTVAMPMTRSGYHMKPTRERALAAVSSTREVFAVLPRGERIDVLPDGAAIDVIASPPDGATALALLDRDDVRASSIDSRR